MVTKAEGTFTGECWRFLFVTSETSGSLPKTLERIFNWARHFFSSSFDMTRGCWQAGFFTGVKASERSIILNSMHTFVLTVWKTKIHSQELVSADFRLFGLLLWTNPIKILSLHPLWGGEGRVGQTYLKSPGMANTAVSALSCYSASCEHRRQQTRASSAHDLSQKAEKRCQSQTLN